MVVGIEFLWNKLMLVDHIVVVEGTFVRKVVGSDREASGEVDGLPVNPGD